MAEQRRFSAGKTPYIRKADTSTYGTEVIMRDFVISLLPLIIFAWVKNGLLPFIDGNVGVLQMLYPLIFVFIGGFSSIFIERIFYYIVSKDSEEADKKLKHSYGLIPGLLLAMVLPINTPIWILLLGVVFGVVVGKLLFGGFGYNIFNPALIGYVFIISAFYGVIVSSGGVLNANEIGEITSGVTPLTGFKGSSLNPEGLSSTIEAYGGLGNFFLGFIPGSIAETSSLLCIVSFAYLAFRKAINWRIPVVYVGTVFILSYIIGAINGYATDFTFALFSVLSGGLFFGAVFMATEPVTSPRTPNGKIIYALFLGVLTVMLRNISGMPEGVATSILFMNLFTPTLDNVFAKVRVADKPSKMVVNYAIAGLLVVAIFGFTLLQMGA
jgi:electron transport complex protein RnfD